MTKSYMNRADRRAAERQRGGITLLGREELADGWTA